MSVCISEHLFMRLSKTSSNCTERDRERDDCCLRPLTPCVSKHIFWNVTREKSLYFFFPDVLCDVLILQSGNRGDILGHIDFFSVMIDYDIDYARDREITLVIWKMNSSWMDEYNTDLFL